MSLLDSVVYYGANPGRSGHNMSIETAQQIYDCRSKISGFFGCSENCEDKVVFTPGCTYSLNYVIKGVLGRGDHVVISNLEHNAVTRPLHKLAKIGVSYSVAKSDYERDEDIVNSFVSSIRRNTRLVVCTHASNVTGQILPIEKIGRLCRSMGILFAVDCSQTAGIIPIDMQRMNINYLCAPAHKGLYGTAGLGILIINSPKKLKTLIEGGTGSVSSRAEQPEIIPDRFESGTVNVPGICALSGGIDFINKQSIEKIYEHEKNIISIIYNKIKDIKNVHIYADPTSDRNVPILIFNIDGYSSEQTAFSLNENHIAVRAGLHCAPSAHRVIGTLPDGAVRICPSFFTTEAEADFTAEAIRKIAEA